MNENKLKESWLEERVFCIVNQGAFKVQIIMMIWGFECESMGQIGSYNSLKETMFHFDYMRVLACNTYKLSSLTK